MREDMLIKIKDSVDIFLSNEKYVMVYFMNSRQRKSFKINDEMIHLFECIDGTKTAKKIAQQMLSQFSVPFEDTYHILNILLDNRIITEVVVEQNYLPSHLVEQYKRQINYFAEFLGSEEEGIKAQKKLMDSHVFIFGCGAIGGNIAIQLAMSGVGYISLYDYDIVQASDVSRHMYFNEQYEKLDKIDALKSELVKINPDIKVTIYREAMKPQSEIEKLLKEVTFVVNTLDEPYIGYTSSKISRICVKHNIAHYIAGGFDAHLASTGEIIIPYVTPCVECYADHFKETLKDWKPKKHPVTKRYEEIGGLASMSLFSSSYACIEIIKYLTGLVQMQESYKVRGEFLFHDMSLTYLNVKKNPECPVCGGILSDEA